MFQPTLLSNWQNNRAQVFRRGTLFAALLIVGGTPITVYAAPNTDSACQTINIDNFGNLALQCGEGANATGGASTAVGTDASSTGFNHTAIGSQSTATGTGSTAVGSLASAMDDAISVGFAANASNNAVAVGSRSASTGIRSTAVGGFAEATKVDSTALGYRRISWTGICKKKM